MLTTAQDFFVVVATVVCTICFVLVLNRLWTPDDRRAHNNLIGWQLSIIGTIYAVILGFMLYTVWTNFGQADLNADAEANALVNIFHLSSGLPAQQQAELKQFAHSYAGAVLQQDWPAMAQDQDLPQQSRRIHRAMWLTLMSVKAASPTEITAEDHAISELSSLAEHRRIRQQQSKSRIPSVLWAVLLIGGGITIVSSCLFGSENDLLHIIQVAAISLLITLVLVAIGDIDRPFQGSVHVAGSAFRRAQQSMEMP